METTETIELAYNKAIECLRNNISTIGFTASTETVSNYRSIWARDHSICAIAAILTKDKELEECAKKGILHLLRKQIDHGQVPSYIEIENRKRVYGGLGSITAIDSNMWIAIVAAICTSISPQSFESNALKSL
jgi:glycogen debranching enzyme